MSSAAATSSLLGSGRPSIGLISMRSMIERSSLIRNGDGKAEEHGARAHEIAEKLPVLVERRPGAAQVRRHQIDFASDGPALQLAIGVGDVHRGCQELPDVAG